MPWRRRRWILRGVAVVTVGVVTAVLWVTLRPPAPIEGVCRSLAEGNELAPVPGDVLERAAETSDVRLRGLSEPSLEQLAATRAELVRQTVTGDTSWIDEFTACLVDYSRTGRAGDPEAEPPVAPIIQRDHVAALLLYRPHQTRVDPCFGPAGACVDEPTYEIHCAMFTDAGTGRVLRLEGCWGFKRNR
ncbi:hypothetical protein SAMN05192576_3837 [Nocardioides szechwanensis]|uniref:Uncharacterized protein n=1 Tax=Nocardioides szechwanensis TaxID=1005944 RepID=A0A1H0ILG1_9ACTN|nr:hypothetical protein [Nocardioides szechwanensis]SDO32185.1 hypothetical protein SAMN05192576_3837 [Nocardioides szechwanensis]